MAGRAIPPVSTNGKGQLNLRSTAIFRRVASVMSGGTAAIERNGGGACHANSKARKGSVQLEGDESHTQHHCNSVLLFRHGVACFRSRASAKPINGGGCRQSRCGLQIYKRTDAIFPSADTYPVLGEAREPRRLRDQCFLAPKYP